jgi:hypothetical protein
MCYEAWSIDLAPIEYTILLQIHQQKYNHESWKHNKRSHECQGTLSLFRRIVYDMCDLCVGL